jgi:GTP-binding protein HflX
MTEPKRTQLTIHRERALLVSVILPGSDVADHDPLGELRSLVRTAGARVVDEMVVKRSTVHPGLYVGTGKAEEIAGRARQNHLDAVVFDNDLSPAQIRDLERIIDRKVLDRSEVILDIFAAHARTAESRLQVELAQLEYTYPRLRRMWTHLERLAGGAATAAGAVGGIGTRGPGEKQIEIDRRLVQRRVAQLRRRIAAIDKRKQRLARSRSGHFRICLVGYTNAGKSTLMNLLTGAGVYVADQLFATLDTRTRRWNLGDGQVALLSDTVGFISNLPHHLVASFRATLEEAIEADLLLHVADASHPRVSRQIRAVKGVLEELGCDRKDQLLVLNKIDRINDPSVRAVLADKLPEGIFVSAATGASADRVVQAVLGKMCGPRVNVTIQADYTNARLMHYLSRHARTDRQTYEGKSVRMTATLSEKHLAELRGFGPAVKILAASPEE